MCRHLDREDLIGDDRFADARARFVNRAECVAVLEEIFAGRSLAEWKERFATLETPWAPMQNAAEMFEDPQVIENGYLRPVDGGEKGTFSLVANPGPVRRDPRRPGAVPRDGRADRRGPPGAGPRLGRAPRAQEERGDPLRIDRRFQGPPDSGNGGYVAGLLALEVEGDAEITLRAPPPLDRDLQVIPVGEGVRLLDGDTLVAEARPSTLDLEPPTPVSHDDALAVRDDYVGFVVHPFARCFVCGPERGEGDGLRVFAAPLTREGDLVAAAWVPDPGLADGGVVRPEHLVAALDCPGAFALDFGRGSVYVLGRIRVGLRSEVAPGERCVVQGWRLEAEGKKAFAGTALFGDDGRLCGLARQTWIRVSV